MPRIASALLVAALLVATAAAFAVTERLKLVRSPIAATEIDRVFSPVCGCETDEAAIAFRLRRPTGSTSTVVDGGGDVVRTLVRSRSAAGRAAIEASWDGRDDAGNVVPEGDVQAARPPRRPAPHDRVPEPDEVDTRRRGAELV